MKKTFFFINFGVPSLVGMFLLAPNVKPIHVLRRLLNEWRRFSLSLTHLWPFLALTAKVLVYFPWLRWTWKYVKSFTVGGKAATTLQNYCMYMDQIAQLDIASLRIQNCINMVTIRIFGFLTPIMKGYFNTFLKITRIITLLHIGNDVIVRNWILDTFPYSIG